MQNENLFFPLASVRALLLNSSYEPMKVVPWQKALILWFQDKVEILEYHSTFVRSARTRFQLPSVLRLKTYVRPKSLGVVRFCRENVYIRDNYTCQYCAEKFPLKHLTLDHVVPASKKGEKSWTNIVTACRECNHRKANRTPAMANMPLLREPWAPTWLPSPELDLSPQTVPSVWLDYLPLKSNV